MTSSYGDLSGWILSPNYPNQYSNNQDCTMTLTFANPSNGRMVIAVTSVEFSLQSCCDALSITDDVDSYSYNDNGQDLAAGGIVRCEYN